MLIILGSVNPRTPADVKAKRKRSRAILKAVAEGMSFEQILARNPNLNYHDIFRAAAEAPTSHWSRKGLRF